MLLTTSKYSRISPAPVRVSLGVMQYKPDPADFPVKNVPVAMLMEGEFTSLYKNRIPPAISENKEIGFKESSVKTGMVVVADGDIMRNDYLKGQPVPLGFDKYTNMTYGNKSFLLNVIDYLCDDSGMMVIRNKDYRLRLIDPAVLEANTQPLKLINLLSPLVLILLFGVFKFYKRRRQYAQ